MADQISICNMALAEIVADPIESLNEASPSAAQCGIFYKQCLRILLEAHPWGFATKREPLAPIVNPRPGEWPGAFAMPVDVGRPIKVIPASLVSGLGAHWWLDDGVGGVPYVIEDGILYAATADPVFAYTVSDINAAALPAMFVDAFVFELASRIVMPIKKSREMKSDLVKQAEIAKQRAMADDMNRQPITTVYIDEIERVRAGGDYAFDRRGYL